MKPNFVFKIAAAALAFTCVAFADAGTDARSLEKGPSFVTLSNATSLQKRAVEDALAARGKIDVAVDTPRRTIFKASLNAAERAAAEALPGVLSASLVPSIVVVNDAADFESCTAAVARTGAVVRETLGAIHVLTVEAVPSEAAAIVQLPCVQSIALDNLFAGPSGIAGAMN